MKLSFVLCHVADGKCVSDDDCYCKVGPGKGIVEGSYPPGTVITVNCQNW